MKAFYENRNYSVEIPLSASVSQNLDFVAHWHTDIEIIYVCKGSIGVGINSEYRILQKGEIAVCGSNDIHYYHQTGIPTTVNLIIFRPEILNAPGCWPANLMPCSVFMDSSFFSINGVSNGMQNEIKNTINKIVEEMSQKQQLYTSFTNIRVIELFLLLFRYIPSYYENSKKNIAGLNTFADIKPMQKALKYIQENYTKNISLEVISSEANLSRFYFSRLFRKTTGMNFNAYLNRIRIDNAEALIRSTRKTILEIAYETGFNSIRTFNRSFRSIKGTTPQSLRAVNICSNESNTAENMA